MPTADMASNIFQRVLGRCSFYAFGFFNWFLYLGLFIKSGAFFKTDSEQDTLQHAIGRSILSANS